MDYLSIYISVFFSFLVIDAVASVIKKSKFVAVKSVVISALWPISIFLLLRGAGIATRDYKNDN